MRQVEMISEDRVARTVADFIKTDARRMVVNRTSREFEVENPEAWVVPLRRMMSRGAVAGITFDVVGDDVVLIRG